MIRIDEEALKKAELLSKLKIESDQRERTMTEMEKLLRYAELLNEADTEGILPLSHGESLESGLREDVVRSGDGREATLSGAPKREADCFVVPKTV